MGTSAHAATGVRRIAVVLGNNAGDGSRPALRYAEQDAAKVARVLREVGDVQAQDLFLLQGRGPAELELTLAQVRRSVAEAHAVPQRRAQLILYYSGHGDGESLHLGKHRLSFAQLKAMLAGTGADTRIAIFDACQSGQAVLQKGGAPAAEFAIHLTDELAVSGDAVIASTAPSESALESSELEGSFFTSHLVSGLRGAADFSGDREVTLSEAYRYAYERTVSTTSLTPSGAQHPSYKFNLTGAGEVVLTSLVRAPAQLTLPAGTDRALIKDALRNTVVAEVLPGAARTLALSPGTYVLQTVREGRTLTASITLTDGARRTLRWDELDAATSQATLAKKGPAPSAPTPTAPAPKPDAALRLCVLPFKNLTGDAGLDYLSDALPEAITTDFGAQPNVRLIERGQLQLDLQELEFSASRYVNPATRAQLGRIHGAEVVVLGAYQQAAGTLRVNARFVRVETGEVVYSLKLERPASKRLDVQDALAQAVRSAIPVVRERMQK